MRELPPEIADRLRAAYTATAEYFGKGAMLIGAVMLVCIGGGIARGVWGLVVFSAVFFGLLLALLIVMMRRYRDPANSPVMRALFDAPEQITSIVKTHTQSSTGMFRTEWLQIRIASKKHLGLKLEPVEIDRIRRVLAERSPHADVKPPLADSVPQARVVRRD